MTLARARFHGTAKRRASMYGSTWIAIATSAPVAPRWERARSAASARSHADDLARAFPSLAHVPVYRADRVSAEGEGWVSNAREVVIYEMDGEAI